MEGMLTKKAVAAGCPIEVTVLSIGDEIADELKTARR